jgi:hypothetical protein
MYEMSSLDLNSPLALPLKDVAASCYAHVTNLSRGSVIGLITALVLVFNYLLQVHIYHRTQSHLGEHQIPPKYLSLVPFLGSAIPFLLDNADFLRTAT